MSAPAALHDSRTSRFEICGAGFEATSPGFAEAVAAAYAAQQRPRCLCQPRGVEMYVAKLRDGYIVKRMPETGSLHAPWCASFEPSADVSGRGPLLGTAICEDPVTGHTTLRLGFPLSSRPRRPNQSQPGVAPGCAASRFVRLSIRGLLHYLWDQADLTRWHPGFQGKRSWPLVRHQLLIASEQKVAGGTPLDSSLYVPEAFSRTQAEAIDARRRTNWAGAVVRPGGDQRLMLIIGELKGLTRGRQGYKAVIKHLPDTTFSVDEGLHDSIGRNFGRELDLWGALDDIRLVVAGTFGLRNSGVPAFTRLCLMTVSKDWLPVETVRELHLVEGLIHERRAFRKLLRYDLPSHETIASVALTDEGDAPRMLAVDGTHCVGAAADTVRGSCVA